MCGGTRGLPKGVAVAVFSTRSGAEPSPELHDSTFPPVSPFDNRNRNHRQVGDREC